MTIQAIRTVQLSIRRAVTIVELTVVLLITLVMLAILLPAANTARERAGEVCKNNLCHLSVAISSLHEVNKRPGAYLKRSGASRPVWNRNGVAQAAGYVTSDSVAVLAYTGGLAPFRFRCLL